MALYRKSRTILQELLRYFLYHAYMTHSDIDSRLVHQTYDANYDPEIVAFAIASLHQIGYTVVSPFIRESQVQACQRIVEACEDLESRSSTDVSDDQIVALCTLALTHLSKIDTIIDVIVQRRIVDVHEVNAILRVMERITENT